MWVKNELDYHTRRKDHEVSRMLPLSQYDVKRLLVGSFNTGVDAQVKVAMAFMYYLGLRQSEVVPYSASLFDPERNLTRDDVGIVGQYLWIHQKWSKTLQRHDQNRDVFLPKGGDPLSCAYTFLKNALDEIPTSYARQPLAVFRNGAPLTTSFLTQCLRTAVANMGLEPALHSLHSLRRSASTHAHDTGFTGEDIQRFGGWSSSAHELYIKSMAQVTVSSQLVDNIASIDLSQPEEVAAQNYLKVDQKARPKKDNAKKPTRKAKKAPVAKK